MTRMSLRLTSCRSVRLSFAACMVALLVASPLAGEDPQSPYDEPATPDLAQEELVREGFSKLEKQLAILFPDSTVHVIPMAERVIVRGGAADAEEAQRILQIVRAAAASFSRDSGDQGAEIRDGAIVNMLELPPEPQIMLNVKFAIIERSQLKTLAAAAHIFGNHPSGDASDFATIVANEPVLDRLVTWIDEEESSSVMAMPTLTVLNGHAASVMYPANHPSGWKSGTSFRFDLALEIKPDVTDRNWIKLEITSSHNASVKDGGESSRVATTVKLREGQSVVLSHDVASPGDAKYRHIPLPGLSRQKAKANQSKVSLCIVTPELVRPMDPDKVPPLPGFQVTAPNDIELYQYAKSQGYPDSNGSTPSSAYYLQDDVKYFPTGPEFLLTPIEVPLPASAVRHGLSPRPEQIAPADSAAENHVRFGPGQITQVSGIHGASFGEVFPVPLPAPGVYPPGAFPSGGVSPTQRLPTPIQQVSGSESTDRMTHLRAALTALQAAGLTTQVRAVERAIEIEQIAQKQRDVEALQQEIQTSRRRLGIPEPLPERPLPAGAP